MNTDDSAETEAERERSYSGTKSKVGERGIESTVGGHGLGRWWIARGGAEHVERPRVGLAVCRGGRGGTPGLPLFCTLEPQLLMTMHL